MKRKYLLITSVLTNLVFLVVLIDRIQKPSFNELSEDNTIPLQTRVSPQVFGKQEEENLEKVIKVIDGDTIVLENGETLRYIGIDAPEFTKEKECFAEESFNRNKELVLGKIVRLEKDISERDKYKRLLAYVWIPHEENEEEILVNEYLVKEGFAKAKAYPPDVKYSEKLQRAENIAQSQKKGLWSKCINTPETSFSEIKTLLPKELKKDNLVSQECPLNKYDCSDFDFQEEAQKFFDVCKEITNDIHKLDSDNDGIACETLP